MKNLSFSYGERTILEDINLSIKKNTFISIMGKSGEGKSTLLYILGGFIKPNNGSYLFENKNVFSFGEFGLGKFRKKNIGYLFQDFRLLPFLNVEQNIRFPFYFSGKKYEKYKQQSLMEELGIWHRRKAYPREISGGEAQRVALGRALMLEPKVLLLDEPTGNLDESTEIEILNILLSLRKRGFTLVCVTHSHHIRSKSDEIWDLENQKIIVSRNNSKTKNIRNVKRVAKKASVSKSKKLTSSKKALNKGTSTKEKNSK